jgi:hypothetical protein
MKMRYVCLFAINFIKLQIPNKFHTVDTMHLRHIKLSYRPTDAH